MKYLVTFLLFSFFVYPSYSQPGFNKLIDAGYDKNHIRDMIVVNDTVIGYGMGFDSPINGNQGVVLVKIDTFGNLLKSNLILDPLGEPLSIDKQWGKIIHTSDGGFAMTAATVGRPSAFLIKTGPELQVEFIKEYPDTVNLSNYFYKIIEVENGYLLYGRIQQPDYFNRPFVRKVDHLGNTEWFKYFGETGITNTFVDGGKFNDSLYIFGGVRVVSPIELSSSIIMVINGNGTVVNTWDSGPHPEMGFLRNLVLTGDGGVLVFGQYLVDVDLEIVQPALTKLNSNFEIEWVRHFGNIVPGDIFIRFWDMEHLQNNEFIGAGQSRIKVNGKNEPSGWLMKFNVEGDSIWSRYDFPDFPVDSLGDTFFGGVGVLSSGSIVAGGTATLWNQHAIWLVKVTTDGCLEVINCGLVPTTFRPGEEEGGMVVYPNPSDGAFTVHFNGAFGQGSGTLALFDLQGKRVYDRPILSGEAGVDVNLQSLPTGFYFVKTFSGNRVLQTGKLVITH